MLEFLCDSYAMLEFLVHPLIPSDLLIPLLPLFSMTTPMRIFLAGIMQGSLPEPALHAQDYRRVLRGLLADHLPQAHVFCPYENHNGSLTYTDDLGRRVFLDHVDRAAASDVLLAYLPEASMGTAIEMWQAYQFGRTILTISPLEHNWVVRFLSHRVFPSLDAFAATLATGELAQYLATRCTSSRRQ